MKRIERRGGEQSLPNPLGEKVTEAVRWCPGSSSDQEYQGVIISISWRLSSMRTMGKSDIKITAVFARGVGTRSSGWARTGWVAKNSLLPSRRRMEAWWRVPKTVWYPTALVVL